MRPLTSAGWAGLLAALTTAGIEPPSLLLHDFVGRWAPTRVLPACVVTVDGPMEEARAAVLAAGADSVWVALPEGDARVAGARPDPGTLRAGADGRVRWDGAARLPLPEALPGLLRLEAAQLGPHTPRFTLAGRDAVLVWADPATGLRALAPGSREPVDRGELLAVALGAARDQASLLAFPLPVAAGFVGVITAAWSLLLTRWLPRRGVVYTLLAAPVVLAACVVARAVGWDLPVGGLLVGLGAAAAGRALLTTSDALSTLDRVLAWLGAPPEDPGRPTRPEALLEMVDVMAPGLAAAVWRRERDGAARLVGRLAGRGEVPALAQVPDAPKVTPTGLVVPLREGNEVIGALALASDAPLPSEVTRVASVWAQAPTDRESDGMPADPFQARLALANVAVRRALARVERWETLLGQAGGVLGVFDLAGGLVTGSEALRDLTGDGARPPLLAALSAATSLDDDALRETVRATLAGARPVRVPARRLGEEVALTPMGPAGARTGFLLVVHDVSDHWRADQLKTGILAATDLQVRNTLVTLGGLAIRTAEEPDADTRRALATRAEAEIQRLAAGLSRAEGLILPRAGSAALEPVDLPDAVRQAASAFRSDRADRLMLQLPEVSAPVAARRQPLVQALTVLFAETTAHARVRVWLVPDRNHVHLLVEDDGGALPEAVLAVHVDAANPTSAAAAARRLVEDMGGAFRAEPAFTHGTRYQMTLRHF